MANCRNCDVVVVGGGPAGSTIASLLAQKRRHVVVLEKERFPRFHVGESLLPLNLPIFDRLGVADDVQRIGIYKPGAELISNAHGAATTFHFADNPYLSVGYSYHVRRADFDKLLLDNCRRLGAEVREGTRVTDVAIDSHPCVTAVGPDGVPTRWLSRFLVDASGRDTLLANRLKLKQIDKRNNTAAVFGHFRNVPHLSGDRAGMISVHLFQHGWFWVIPLPDDITSVGVVGRQAMFKARDTSLDVLFARAVAACPSLAKQMAVAEPTGPLLACADYSYNSQSYVGENHILIGDAAAFIDPLFSSGVMMAMSSAIFGELVVNACLDGRPSRAQLARDYQHKIRLSLDSLSWLIFRINDPILRDLLMSSADLLNTRQQLIKILAGNFYTRHSLLSPLRRVQLAYGCLVLLSKFGFYLGQEGTVGRARSDTRTRA